MKPHAGLLAILLACCGASASADVVVLANRARQAVGFELLDEQQIARSTRLPRGAAWSFPANDARELRLTIGGESLRYELEPGEVYYFHDRGGAGPTELAQIRLRHVERPPIADEAEPPGEAQQAEPPDASGRSVGVFRLPVKILVDDDQRAARPYWEPRLRKRVAAASEVFERSCGIGFEVVAADVWKSSDRLADFDASLAEFQREVDPSPGRLAIGFSSQHRISFGQAHLDGFRGPLGKHVLLREQSPHVSEIERVELLVHELGHYLGAAHCPESSSVMRPRLADRQALARSFRVGFDPLNVLAMSTVAEEVRNRGVEHFGLLSPSARRRLRDVYATLLETLPSDPAAESFLGYIADPAPIRAALKEEVEAEHEQGEPLAKQEAAGEMPGDREVQALEPPLVVATRTALRAISARARRFQQQTAAGQAAPSGQELFAAYVRAAAEAAVEQPADVRTQAFLLALAIGLDRSDALRKYAVMSDLVTSIEPSGERDRRLEALGAPTIEQRHDLVQHFVLAAAIASSSGAKSAEAVALAKQLHDARYGGGFSFAAWCADLSGIAFARRVQDGPESLANLARAFRVETVLPSLDGLPGGLSIKEFKARYGSATDERFRELDAEIRRRLAALPGSPSDGAD
ncbi:MAG TPA: hypothetical protein VMV10_12865 [Pirellulales bacterium]|nr:hypothetical protein [Pirellulales bacterium]